MKYIFYRIILFNGKNKRVYKKETSIKLYCKLNGKMIDIKKYKELCKKLKPKKVKSTKTKKVKSTKTKKVKSTKTKKVKSTKTKKVKSTRTKKFNKTKKYQGGEDVVDYDMITFRRWIENAKVAQEHRQNDGPEDAGDDMYEVDNIPVGKQLITFHLRARQYRELLPATNMGEREWLRRFAMFAEAKLQNRGFKFFVDDNWNKSKWTNANGSEEWSIPTIFAP